MVKIFKNSILVQRLTQGLLGIVTIFLVVHKLSQDQQGWYFTFSSIASIYTLFDLGLSVVLVQLSAHFFSRLKWIERGGFEGGLAKEFARLIRHSTRFYQKLAFAYILIVGSFGLAFFLNKEGHLNLELEWTLPWLLLVCLTGLNALTLPFTALVEGSGKINEVYFVRIIQILAGSVCLWIALILGYQLWALSMLPLMSFLVVLVWLLYSKPVFLKTAISKSGQDFHWKEEVWPLQWRVGLSWLAGYLLTQIYTPILFYYDSPKIAGQMGLSLTIANMLGLLAQSWIALRVPDMGKSVANKDWDKLDQIFKYNFKLSLLMYLLGSLLLFVLVILINEFSSHGDRILPVLPFLGLLAVVLINHINGAFASHLRSYKKEPLVFVTLISTIVTIPIALYGASKFSVNGVVAAILLVQLIFALPVTIFYWSKFNREWRLDQ